MFSFGVLLYLLVTGSHPFLEAPMLTACRWDFHPCFLSQATYEETWDATLRLSQ